MKTVLPVTVEEGLLVAVGVEEAVFEGMVSFILRGDMTFCLLDL